MLTTFTTEHGLLVIRSEDIRRIEDIKQHDCRDGTDTPACIVEWSPIDGDLQVRHILGTAAENRDRIIGDEMKLVAAYEEMQQRKDRGLPPLAIQRGRR